MTTIAMKVRLFKIEQLKEVLGQCTEEQQTAFHRIHGPIYGDDINAIPDDKIDQAYDLCCRTIAMNMKG